MPPPSLWTVLQLPPSAMAWLCITNQRWRPDKRLCLSSRLGFSRSVALLGDTGKAPLPLWHQEKALLFCRAFGFPDFHRSGRKKRQFISEALLYRSDPGAKATPCRPTESGGEQHGEHLAARCCFLLSRRLSGRDLGGVGSGKRHLPSYRVRPFKRATERQGNWGASVLAANASCVLSGSIQASAKNSSALAAPAAPPPSLPVTPRKNKAAMCKPLMQNRGVSCKIEMKSKGCQTGEALTYHEECQESHKTRVGPPGAPGKPTQQGSTWVASPPVVPLRDEGPSNRHG